MKFLSGLVVVGRKLSYSSTDPQAKAATQPRAECQSRVIAIQRTTHPTVPLKKISIDECQLSIRTDRFPTLCCLVMIYRYSKIDRLMFAVVTLPKLSLVAFWSWDLMIPVFVLPLILVCAVFTMVSVRIWLFHAMCESLALQWSV